ncbi:MAG: C13 family peptidase, partial [Promethearchaeota archaeon]
TKANLENEILNFLGQAIPGEIVIFYYCGHGGSGSLRFLDESVQINELDEWLLSGGLPQAFVTVILDTCHSGSWIADGEGTTFGYDRVVLAACRSGQSSWGWCEHWSWFTYVGVIEGFQSADDSNEDGWISAAEDFTYAKPHTESYASEIGLTQNPTSYFGVVDGDIPLVQRDITKPFPVWDVAVIHAETSTDFVLAGSLVTIAVTVENQGVKTWRPLISVYYGSTFAVSQTVTVNPGEMVTLSIVWNTTGTYRGLYIIGVTASTGPGETDIADNTLVDGTIEVYNAIIDIKPQNLKLKSKGCWVTCYIELPPIFGADVYEIDVSSIKLGSEVPAEGICAIEDFDHDRVLELVVKFDREAVVSYILSTGVDGYVTGFSRWATLRVTGKLFSGTPFEGYDTIKVTFHPLRQELK